MITARAAILQALRRGPGYGRLLIRRVQEATGGRAVLGPGSVYPALRGLQRARLVRQWVVVTGRVRGGRSRTYYELTVAGVHEAEAETRALASLLDASAPGSPPAGAAMTERVRRVSELFDFAVEARDALRRTRRRA